MGRLRTIIQTSSDAITGKTTLMLKILIASAALTVGLTGPQIIETKETPETPVLENDNNHVIIKSPIIGTFYRKPSPDKPSFVEVGQKVSKGDVICVIEAMKLFNEIESDFSGEIVKILVDDQSPVEFDQPLFLIDPS